MAVVVVALLWIVLGALLGLHAARRGHWRWLWLLGAIAGPFTLPLIRQMRQNEKLAAPIELSRSSLPPTGGLRVLAGIDGSRDSIDAAKRVAELLRARLTNLTLAMVMDFEANEPDPGPFSHESPPAADQKSALSGAAAALASVLGSDPGTVLLTGRPATALHSHGVSEGFDVLVVGSRGQGLSKRLLGSCADQLTSESSLPVLVIPRGRTDGPGTSADGAAAEARPAPGARSAP